MRIPNPRLLRLSSLVGGAFVEEGDGELILPALIQPVIELPSPIDRVFGFGNVAPVAPADSLFKSDQIVSGGAVGPFTVVMFSLSKGLWKLGGYLAMSMTGTTQTALAGLNILDPASNVANIVAFPMVAGWQRALAFDYVFNFQRDGFVVQLQTPATIAGDVLTINGTVYARKLI